MPHQDLMKPFASKFVNLSGATFQLRFFVITLPGSLMIMTMLHPTSPRLLSLKNLELLANRALILI